MAGRQGRDGDDGAGEPPQAGREADFDPAAFLKPPEAADLPMGQILDRIYRTPWREAEAASAAVEEGEFEAPPPPQPTPEPAPVRVAPTDEAGPPKAARPVLAIVVAALLIVAALVAALVLR